MLVAKGWTRSQVSLAKDRVTLFEATDIFLRDLGSSEEFEKALWNSVPYSDAMCLHLVDALRSYYCYCSEVPALKPPESKVACLRLSAHQRAFWFCLNHNFLAEADRLLSNLDPPSELILTWCHELYHRLQVWGGHGFFHPTETKDVIEKLFQRWRPEWCKPDGNESASSAHHSAISEVSDTNSKSGMQEEDDEDEDDDDGGVLCPSTP